MLIKSYFTEIVVVLDDVNCQSGLEELYLICILALMLMMVLLRVVFVFSMRVKSRDSTITWLEVMASDEPLHAPPTCLRSWLVSTQ